MEVRVLQRAIKKKYKEIHSIFLTLVAESCLESLAGLLPAANSCLFICDLCPPTSVFLTSQTAAISALSVQKG